ncbi:MAG: hybrid sensor histidine kinase/response regulator [Anaeromyxobacter sp.]
MLASLLSLVAAALAAYVALLAHRFSRAPSLADQGWFARIALTAAGYAACNVVTTSPAAPDLWVAVFSRVQFVLAGFHVAAWIRYVGDHTHRASRLDRPATLTLRALGLAALVPGLAVGERVVTYRFEPFGSTYHGGDVTWLGLVCLVAFHAGLAWVGVRLALAWRRGVRHARVLAISVGLLLAMGAHDALVFSGAYHGPYLLDMGMLFPIAAGAYALGAQVVEDARALAGLRQGLELQVQERTAALARSEEARLRMEKLAALGQLSAGVAHEVNNPAAVLAANLRYLREALGEGQPAGAEALECVREAQGAVERIAHMVRQLLDASRMAAAAEKPAHPVELGHAAREALRIARARAPAQVTLTSQVPAGLVALAHEPMVVQVLINLAVNGAQAVPPGRTGHVTIDAARSGDVLRVLVEDDGTGMDPDVLRRVFEPFFSTKPPGVGTGLGLAVSRGLVQAMGGDLRLESAPGLGTRAVVELPAASGETALPPSPEPDRPRGPPRSLLVVDDDPGVRTALARVLAERYAVTLAAGTDEGIALARTGRFDLVLCDVMMRDGGAERMAAALDREAPDAGRRMVLFTGGATSAAARAFLAGDRRPLLYKPLDLEALARIAEALPRAAEGPPPQLP